MKFKLWLEQSAPVEQLFSQMAQTIEFVNEGQWHIINERWLMPSWRLQKYGVMEVSGQQVKTTNDQYYAKIFIKIRKKTGETPKLNWNDIHNPPEFPFDQLDQYDIKNGHPLLSFDCYIEGWKPGADPEERLFPIGGNRTKMQSINRQENMYTPYEVANFIKDSINNWYFRGDDDNEPSAPAPMVPGQLIGI